MRYAILLYDGVEPIDVGAAFGVLSMARRRAPGLEFFGVAPRAGEVVCANGLRVVADHGYDDCPPFRTLVATGGPGWSAAASHGPTLAFVRKLSHTPGALASMCTGAMILAAAGVLAGRTVATKERVFAGETSPADILRAQGDPAVVRAAVADAGGVLTGGGVTLGIDVMFALLRRDVGAEIADEVARVMEYDRALAANRAALDPAPAP